MKVSKIFFISAVVFCTLYAQNTHLFIDNTRLVPKLLNYQGYLTDTLGIPIDDTLDMTFRVFDAVSSGNELWSETQTNVPIERGVFSVMLGEITPIPDSVFADFTSTWLELTLEGPQTLTPRTRSTSVGYAYTCTYSDTAEYARVGVDSDWTLSGNILYPSSDYGLSMRSGNVLYGSNDSTHVNFGIDCTTGTSGQNYKYCAVGGGWRNIAGHDYATVAGGDNNSAYGEYAAVGGGNQNTASAERSTVAGGSMNTASITYSIVGGGYNNEASGNAATIGGGTSNIANGINAAVSGGGYNRASIDYAFVGGGNNNYAQEYYTAICGGSNNRVQGYSGFVGGGTENTANGDYSAVLGGYRNAIGGTADYSYLFGIESAMSSDSTFMVDMPHIRFGDETNGYEFPTADGSADQVLVTDGSGQLSWSSAADTDWVFIGSNMYSGISGNVGIGTTSPSTKLDVNGSVNAGDIYVNDVVCVHMTATDDISTANDAAIGGGLNVGADVYISGSLGVGTSSPSSKVHITGMAADCALEINGSGSSSYFHNDANGLHIKSYDVSNTRQIRFHTGSDWTPEVLITAAGNVGIGTTTPAVELDVSGTIDADDIVCVHITATDDIATASNATVGGALYVNMDGTFDGTVTASSGMSTVMLDVNGTTGYNQIRMRTSYTPTGTSDPNGASGDIAWDDSYFYVKTSAGWKRAALSTW